MIKSAMTKETKRILIFSVLACLAPIVLGVAVWDRLPDPMPIHWGFGDEPNNWGPKWLAVFGLPVFTAVIDAVCIILQERALEDAGEGRPMFLKVMYWFIPVITIVVYLAMLGYSLNGSFPVGKTVLTLVGAMFVLAGNYLPKMSWSEAKAVNKYKTWPRPTDEASWRTYNRGIGYLMVALGFVALIGVFFV
jgi:uncharacterized membrane protein